MGVYKIQIIETTIVLVIYVICYLVAKNLINNFLKKTKIERGRRKMAIRAIQLFTTITAFTIIIGVWGFKQNQIALFAGSILTAIGIAFFAQWSLLSNITSSILIFFNHPVKIGNRIKVLHKDYNFEGEVTDMNYLFVYLKTEKDEIITIPNSHFFMNSYSVCEPKDQNIENQ